MPLSSVPIYGDGPDAALIAFWRSPLAHRSGDPRSNHQHRTWTPA